MLKKLVSFSLFIYFAVVVAVLTAGLVFYDRQNQPMSGKTNQPAANVPAGTVLSPAEIAKHNNVKDCWLLISGKVYDVSSFMNQHPGSPETILPYCGQDATQAFATKDIGRPHSGSAANLLKNYLLGDLNQKISSVDLQNIKTQIQNTPQLPRGYEREQEDD